MKKMLAPVIIGFSLLAIASAEEQSRPARDANNNPSSCMATIGSKPLSISSEGDKVNCGCIIHDQFPAWKTPHNSVALTVTASVYTIFDTGIVIFDYHNGGLH